jgi:AcrR family transcriptional regulator
MGIAERREREREKRRREILTAAWAVAETGGWPLFSMERVAAAAELGRATIYGYFPSLDALVTTMAEEARPAAFALLFPPADCRPLFGGPEITRLREEAQQMIRALRSIAARSGATLPDDAAAAEVFLEGIAMAGATVPELRESTSLRRRWQEFCLSLEPRPNGASQPATDEAAGGKGA